MSCFQLSYHNRADKQDCHLKQRKTNMSTKIVFNDPHYNTQLNFYNLKYVQLTEQILPTLGSFESIELARFFKTIVDIWYSSLDSLG